MARDRPEARRLEPAPMSNAHDRIPTLAILPVVVSAVPCPIVLSMLERRRLNRIRLVFFASATTPVHMRKADAPSNE
jgi:hypothetical protein